MARNLLLALLAGLLGGCMLVSGERTSSDIRPESGNLVSSFISADGISEHELEIGDGPTRLDVIVIVEAAQGVVRLDLFDPEGSPVMIVESRPNESVTATGAVVIDAQGILHYRVVTRSARGGSYQILYQRAAGPPTPTVPAP
ncbi:MAG TPA: hypothetical protein PKA05_14065 [Roseiflexaceae bacterium]|nr:hypothetical protein [Roseiflexaceae bacterium]HMP41502.1 hypothetical protein [Roseiflexaceae bacterium]